VADPDAAPSLSEVSFEISEASVDPTSAEGAFAATEFVVTVGDGRAMRYRSLTTGILAFRTTSTTLNPARLAQRAMASSTLSSVFILSSASRSKSERRGTKAQISKSLPLPDNPLAADP
jgi:hypothetical protein